MKCSIIIIVLFSLATFCGAQQPTYPVIGKPLPDFTISKVFGKPRETLSLADLKGKYTILDFWWVGCAGCIKSFPKMDSIDRSRDNLDIILVGLDKPRRIAKQNIDVVYEEYQKLYDLQIKSVFDESIFTNFMIESAPTLIWIDPDGIVQAITNQIGGKTDIDNFLSGIKIDAKMVGPDFHLFQKENYKIELPLLTNGIMANGGANDTSFLFRSLLTEYKSGMAGGGTGDLRDGYSMVESRWVKPVMLFRKAYGDDQFFKDSVISIITDFQDKETRQYFSKDYGYSLKVPENKKTESFLRQIMQNDLFNYFGCKAYFRDTIITKWALVDPEKKALSNLKKIWAESKDKTDILEGAIHIRVSNNQFINSFDIINSYLKSENKLLNETGIPDDEMVYIEMEFPLYDNDSEIYRYLESFGFEIQPRIHKMKNFVITDKY